MALREAVLRIRPDQGAEIQIGQVCRVDGEWAFVTYARSEGGYGRTWRWVKLNGWGLSWSMIEWCAAHGIERFVVYDKDRDLTYNTTLERLLKFGVAGKPDAYGQNVGLEDDHWTTRSGKPRKTWLDNRAAIVLEPRYVPERIGPAMIVRDAAGRVSGLSPEKVAKPKQGSLLE